MYAYSSRKKVSETKLAETDVFCLQLCTEHDLRDELKIRFVRIYNDCQDNFGTLRIGPVTL